MPSLPRRTRIYRHHHLDSTRWDDYRPRSDDIVITTAYKAGTTWMQAIVASLIFQEEPMPDHLQAVSPWVDFRVMPPDVLASLVEAQTHRRFFKSHLPLDGLPYFPEVKYIVLARDGRDVFMSLRNHLANYTDEMRALVNDTPGRVGDPLPPFEPDIHVAFHDWLTRGSFEWERDGYPFISIFHYLATWWPYRHLPNIRLVHYNDLLDDLEGEMREIASYLGIEVPRTLWPRLVQGASFTSMQRDAERYGPQNPAIFRGGPRAFIYKGTNGRWRGVLTEAELAQYDQVVHDRLPAACASWLAQGTSALR